jgi:hypothetical protein
MDIFKIEMRAEVVDNITGFAGKVTARAEYLTGCRQYLVQPKQKKDTVEYPEGHWCDEGRLIENIQEDEKRNNGGPMDFAAPVK